MSVSVAVTARETYPWDCHRSTYLSIPSHVPQTRPSAPLRAHNPQGSHRTRRPTSLLPYAFPPSYKHFSKSNLRRERSSQFFSYKTQTPPVSGHPSTIASLSLADIGISLVITARSYVEKLSPHFSPVRGSCRQKISSLLGMGERGGILNRERWRKSNSTLVRWRLIIMPPMLG